MTTTNKYQQQNIYNLLQDGHINIFLPAGIQNMPISFTVGEYRLYPSILENNLTHKRLILLCI